ncbi:MAG: hypothetical protein FD147_215 [Chloroflexi bacterium]|nr:MAG: hypothetical protein FD147_215 [Chloroflexota bacterium]MBA4374739.1 hypothetical protein [Anaerolinea sp.]
MDESAKSNVCSAVYRQFPELRGENPSVKSIPGGKFQLIFHGKAQAADGKTISRTVRVTADEKGKVLKLTTSR